MANLRYPAKNENKKGSWWIIPLKVTLHSCCLGSCFEIHCQIGDDLVNNPISSHTSKQLVNQCFVTMVPTVSPRWSESRRIVGRGPARSLWLAATAPGNALLGGWSSLKMCNPIPPFILNTPYSSTKPWFFVGMFHIPTGIIDGGVQCMDGMSGNPGHLVSTPDFYRWIFHLWGFFLDEPREVDSPTSFISEKCGWYRIAIAATFWAF